MDKYQYILCVVIHWLIYKCVIININFKTMMLNDIEEELTCKYTQLYKTNKTGRIRKNNKLSMIKN